MEARGLAHPHLLTLLATLAATAALAENRIAMCWRNASRTECGADQSAEKLTKYCRSQCRFWSSGPDKEACAEAWRCERPGIAAVAHSSKSRQFVAACGEADEKQVRERLRQSCPGCSIRVFRIGGMPPRKAPKLFLTPAECRELSRALAGLEGGYRKALRKYQVQEGQLRDYRALRAELLDDTWWARSGGTAAANATHKLVKYGFMIAELIPGAGEGVATAFSFADIAVDALKGRSSKVETGLDVALEVAKAAVNKKAKSLELVVTRSELVYEKPLIALELAETEKGRQELRREVDRQVAAIDGALEGLEALRQSDPTDDPYLQQAKRELEGVLRDADCPPLPEEDGKAGPTTPPRER